MRKFNLTPSSCTSMPFWFVILLWSFSDPHPAPHPTLKQPNPMSPTNYLTAINLSQSPYSNIWCPILHLLQLMRFWCLNRMPKQTVSEIKYLMINRESLHSTEHYIFVLWTTSFYYTQSTIPFFQRSFQFIHFVTAILNTSTLGMPPGTISISTSVILIDNSFHNWKSWNFPSFFSIHLSCIFTPSILTLATVNDVSQF